MQKIFNVSDIVFKLRDSGVEGCLSLLLGSESRSLGFVLDLGVIVSIENDPCRGITHKVGVSFYS